MEIQTTSLAAGVPTRSAYRQLCKSDLFSEIEKFSNSFLHRNNVTLAPYGTKWVTDPLHQWSRQWEYPFAISHIRGFIRSMGIMNPRIIDAGSGVTFFPFYIATTVPESCVLCLDVDKSLAAVFSNIEKERRDTVRFEAGDIRQIPCPDQSINIVYSISVLEHMDNPAKALEEFSRVLERDGLMVLTFDVSLSSDSATINRLNAQRLLDAALKNFKPLNGDNPQAMLESALENSDILTTHYIAQHDIKLLPWHISRRSKLKDFFQRGYLLSTINNLTCFCIAMTKR